MASDSTNQLVTLVRRWRKRRTARHTSALPTSVLSTRAPSRHPVRACSARGLSPATAFPISSTTPAAAAPPGGRARPGRSCRQFAPRRGRGTPGSRRRPPQGERSLAGASPSAASASCLSFPLGGTGRLGYTHRTGCLGPPPFASRRLRPGKGSPGASAERAALAAPRRRSCVVPGGHPRLPHGALRWASSNFE